jgi:hypothetical protein
MPPNETNLPFISFKLLILQIPSKQKIWRNLGEIWKSKDFVIVELGLLWLCSAMTASVNLLALERPIPKKPFGAWR